MRRERRSEQKRKHKKLRNIKIDIQEQLLTVTVDLKQNHGLSRSGKSYTIACSDGNVPLIQDGIYRDEIINLVVFKKRPQEDIDSAKATEVEMMRRQWRDINII